LIALKEDIIQYRRPVKMIDDKQLGLR